MPFHIGAGFGPLRWSHRLGRRRRTGPPAPPVNYAAELQRHRRIVDDLPEHRLRVRNRVGWAFAVLFAAWMFASHPLLWPVGIAALVITWRGHRARAQRRAQAARDAEPPIDPAAELEFARYWGLPVEPWLSATPADAGVPVYRNTTETEEKNR